MWSTLSLILACSILQTLAIPSDNINVLKLLNLQNFGLDFYNNISSLDSVAKYENLNEKCLTQLQAIENGLLMKHLSSIKLIDAWGKVPSGILYGHLVDLGNYDECLGVKHNIATSDYSVQGKYCLADISIGPILNATQIPRLQIGICIPAACKAEELKALLDEVLMKILHTTALQMNSAVLLKESSCSTAEEITFEVIDWAAICILSIIAVFMVASTMYDYLATHYEKPMHPLWCSFSVRANMRQLFHISANNNATHIIPCLHGLRCMSTIWIVFIHTFLKIRAAPNINGIKLDKIQWNRTLFSSFWQGGNMAVNTFLFLSGILVITATFRQMKKNAGRINVAHMYIHRFLRLTPVLALTVLLHMSVVRYLGSGPLREKIDQRCIDNWWATLLYVQNYATNDEACLLHSWYLAVDMQLYLISPLILITIWKWKSRGLAGVVVVGLLLSAALFCIIVMDNLSVVNLFLLFPYAAEEMIKLYHPTHTQAAPWIVGIVFGYYLHCRAGKRAILSKTTAMIGWLGAICALCTVLFALYPSKQLDATPLTAWEGAFYLSLSRIAWPLALAWIVFACMNGFGGPVDQFLSSSLWQPLSKLSYSLYICHLDVLDINVQRIKTNLYLSTYDGILRFWGDFGMSLVVSLLMYLAVESPMLSIEKFSFIERRSKSNLKKGETVMNKTVVTQQTLCD